MTVRVKICGITNVEDAVAAVRLGADYLGLNFYPGSPRCISEGQARLIVQALPQQVTPVALFANAPWERVRETAARLGMRMVQVHGEELSPCPFPGLVWMPAFPVRDASSFAPIEKLLQACASERSPLGILMDGYVPGAFGGTGNQAPWQLLADTLTLFVPLELSADAAPWSVVLASLRKLPNCPLPFRCILAGGLTPDNVAEAIRIVRPWAVDVASGVESSPGKKDHDKMRRFIENARNAASSAGV
jgi:phosphoribosylanthranilate isomerase